MVSAVLQAIRTRFQSPAEVPFVAGGALTVVTFVAGGLGLQGTPALVLGAASAALMLVGVGMASVEVFERPE